MKFTRNTAVKKRNVYWGICFTYKTTQAIYFRLHSHFVWQHFADLLHAKLYTFGDSLNMSDISLENGNTGNLKSVVLNRSCEVMKNQVISQVMRKECSEDNGRQTRNEKKLVWKGSVDLSEVFFPPVWWRSALHIRSKSKYFTFHFFLLDFDQVGCILRYIIGQPCGDRQ